MSDAESETARYRAAFVAPYKNWVTWIGLGNILFASAYPYPILGWIIGVGLVTVGCAEAIHELFEAGYGETTNQQVDHTHDNE